MLVPPRPPAPVALTRARQRAVLLVLAIAGMCTSLTQTLVIPIQGRLPALLDADPADTAWIITSTLLAGAVATPIAGRLGDMFGKRAMVLVLLAVVLGGSVLCALSPGLPTLIAGRALQGVGVGVVPLGIALLRDVLPEDRLGSAIALVSAMLGVGGAIGLPFGALIAEHLDWRMIFVATAVGALLAVGLVLAVVPGDALRFPGRIDVLGILGLAVGLTGVMLAISRGNEWGWTSVSTLVAGGLGVVVLLVWGVYELRVASPLVDLRISARPAVLITNLASVAMGFALFAANIAYPQLLELPTAQGGLGLGLVAASLLLVPTGLTMLVMTPISGRIDRAVGPRPLLAGGAAVIAVAYLLSVVIPLQAWHIGLVNMIIGVGIGMAYAAMPAQIMRAVPQSESGAANGLNTLMRSLGTTSAAAVVGALLAGSSSAGNVVASFDLVFGIGLGVSVLAVVLALCIPRTPARERAREAVLR